MMLLEATRRFSRARVRASCVYAEIAVCLFDVDLEVSIPAVETWSAKLGDTDLTAFISSATDLISRGVPLRLLVKQA
jgi:hypothetical protein